MLQQGLLVIFPVIHKFFAELLKQFVVVNKLRNSTAHLLQHLETPHYSLLILTTQGNARRKFLISYNSIFEQTLLICKDLLLFNDQLEYVFELLHGLIQFPATY